MLDVHVAGGHSHQIRQFSNKKLHAMRFGTRAAMSATLVIAATMALSQVTASAAAADRSVTIINSTSSPMHIAIDGINNGYWEDKRPDNPCAPTGGRPDGFQDCSLHPGQHVQRDINSNSSITRGLPEFDLKIYDHQTFQGTIRLKMVGILLNADDHEFRSYDALPGGECSGQPQVHSLHSINLTVVCTKTSTTITATDRK